MKFRLIDCANLSDAKTCPNQASIIGYLFGIKPDFRLNVPFEIIVQIYIFPHYYYYYSFLSACEFFV